MSISVGVVYDTNFVDNLPSNYTDKPKGWNKGTLGKFTATVIVTGPDKMPASITWSAPGRPGGYFFFDKNFNRIDPPVTDLVSGTATVYVGATSPAYSQIWATVTGSLSYGWQDLTACTVQQPVQTKLLAPPLKATLPVDLHWVNENGDAPRYAMINTLNNPQVGTHPDGSSIVVIWLAYVETTSGVVSKKTLLTDGNNLVWADATSDGYSLPYSYLDSIRNNDGQQNVLQYLVQGSVPGAGATVSPQTIFTAAGTAWARPDPDRTVSNLPSLTPVDINAQPVQLPLSNDSFVEFPPDSLKYFLWFKLDNIDTDFKDTDSILVVYYLDGYDAGTGAPDSAVIRAGPFLIKDLKGKDGVQTNGKPKGVLSLTKSSVDYLGYKSTQIGSSITYTYQLNRLSWSPDVQPWQTVFGDQIGSEEPETTDQS